MAGAGRRHQTRAGARRGGTVAGCGGSRRAAPPPRAEKPVKCLRAHRARGVVAAQRGPDVGGGDVGWRQRAQARQKKRGGAIHALIDVLLGAAAAVTTRATRPPAPTCTAP
jgi:hypothetical protein